MGSAIYSRDSRHENVSPPQEECVNVKQAYFKLQNNLLVVKLTVLSLKPDILC